MVGVSLIGLAIWIRRRDHFHTTSLLLSGAVAALLVGGGTSVADPVATFKLVAAVGGPLAVAVVATVWHIRIRARTRQSPNPLRDAFTPENVLEVDGVQFALFPPIEPLPRRENAYFVAWIQNAMDAPRIVQLRLEEGRSFMTRFPQVALPEPDAVRIEAGEGGQLVGRIHVHGHATENRAYIHPTLVVTRDAGTGEGARRLMWRARPAGVPSLATLRFWGSPRTLGLASKFRGLPFEIEPEDPDDQRGLPEKPGVLWHAWCGKDLEAAFQSDALSRLCNTCEHEGREGRDAVQSPR